MIEGWRLDERAFAHEDLELWIYLEEDGGEMVEGNIGRIVSGC